MLKTIDEIAKQTGSKYFANEPLSKHTSWKVGGPATALFIPATAKECIKLLNEFYFVKIPFLVIGNGSNLLVGDGGFHGVVLKLSGLKNISFEGLNVRSECGATLAALAKLAAERNLSGLEFAAGIPGTVGGAVKMNAGAEGSSISEIFKSAIVWQEGRIKELSKNDMHFAYRKSVLKDKSGVVIETIFTLQTGDKEQIRKKMLANIANRKAKQPLDYPNAGSVFKNPEGNFAGKLIADCGLKGMKIGGAEVSQKHANFIINAGGATARDILLLIEKVRQEVEQLTGIRLETEVELVGEF